jgi:hypothetical protein
LAVEVAEHGDVLRWCPQPPKWEGAPAGWGTPCLPATAAGGYLEQGCSRHASRPDCRPESTLRQRNCPRAPKRDEPAGRDLRRAQSQQVFPCGQRQGSLCPHAIGTRRAVLEGKLRPGPCRFARRVATPAATLGPPHFGQWDVSAGFASFEVTRRKRVHGWIASAIAAVGSVLDDPAPGGNTGYWRGPGRLRPHARPGPRRLHRRVRS